MIHTFLLQIDVDSVFGLALAGFSIMLICLLLLVGLIIKILYLITLQRTMEKVKPENREMTPGQVWLEIIPFFGLVWQFFNVTYISNSLKKELISRNLTLPEARPAYGIGLATCILFCCSIIPLLGGIAVLGGLICWIIYWVKIVSYKNML